MKLIRRLSSSSEKAQFKLRKVSVQAENKGSVQSEKRLSTSREKTQYKLRKGSEVDG